MWKVIAHDHGRGDWTEEARFATVEECKGLISTLSTKANTHRYIFWAGGAFKDRRQIDQVIEATFAANGERVSRVAVGVNFQILHHKDGDWPEPKERCGGNCYCLVERSGRGCETAYYENGLYYVLPCGMSC